MEIPAAITEPVIEKIEPTGVEQPSKRLAIFALVGLFTVFLASVLFRPPAGEYLTICGFKNFTGLPCPGCGLTHSFCALGKGELTDAFGFNLLGPPLFLVLVLIWIRSAFVLSNRIGAAQLLDRIARRFNVAWTFAIGFSVYGIARIVYLVVYHPISFHDSPLSQLITRLIH